MNNKGDFLGVDFHVHTPSSFSCYEGPKTDEEYLNILKRYISKNVKVIAITDHNTLNGYKKFMSIKEGLENKVLILEEFSKNHSQLEEEIKKIKSDISLFDKILILPGVEFEANPGIHLLLIFDPNSNLDKIDEFLEESGYSIDLQGQEDPGEINIDVLKTLEIANSLNAIVIAAHADSDKGIYNCLGGQYRAQIFRSSNLTAISYKNPITCEKMKGIFKQKDYKRTEPISFIQCTDYHARESDNLCITYLKLDGLCFDSIKTALKNPNECVSPTEHPETMNIIKKIIDDDNTITLKDFKTKEDFFLVKKGACAILNNGYGSIMIGVTSDQYKNIVGIPYYSEETIKKLNLILRDIKPNKFSFSINIDTYSYGNNKIIVLKLMSVTDKIFSLDDDNVYMLEDGKVVKATTDYISKLTKTKFLNRMEEFQNLNKEKMHTLMEELNLLQNNIYNFSLINNILEESIPLMDVVDIDFIHPYPKKENLSFKNEDIFGTISGNVFYVSKTDIRFPNVYLRCSCPKTDKLDLESLGIEKYRGPSIIISSGGGSYYINSTEEYGIISLDKQELSLRLTIKEGLEEHFSLQSILAWLKSSLLLWFCYAYLGDTNIYIPRIFKKIPLPVTKSLQENEKIHELIMNICSQETNFIDSVNKQNYNIDCESCNPNCTNKDCDKLSLAAEKHNRLIDGFAYEIDQVFYEFFNIKESESNMIDTFLQLKNFHVLNYSIDE